MANITTKLEDAESTIGRYKQDYAELLIGEENKEKTIESMKQQILSWRQKLGIVEGQKKVLEQQKKDLIVIGRPGHLEIS